ncbi:type IV toxin-antitoxin system AbiEi family antitoxin domain-containing protein [Nocardia sp. NPDC003979]
MEDRLLVLADLAEAQWGLFTSAQAVTAGVTAQQLKRLADAELIIRLRQGVYRLTGAPTNPEDPIRAEWLALAPGRQASARLADGVPLGVVSHRSAALIQGLGDVDADVHEFTVPRRRSTRSPDVKFHVRELSPEDWHMVAGLPVTRPLRTVVDLAVARTDGGHLAGVVRDAILTEDITRDELASALRPYAHYYGFRVGAGEALVHDFIRQAGIPASVTALTRDDIGLDLVFYDAENNPIPVQVKHFRASERSAHPDPATTSADDLSAALLNYLLSQRPGPSSAEVLELEVLIRRLSGRLSGTDSVSAALRRAVQQKDDNENRGGNDEPQISERPGIPERNQRADP